MGLERAMDAKTRVVAMEAVYILGVVVLGNKICGYGCALSWLSVYFRPI